MFAPILAAAPIDLAVFAACALIVLAGALGVVLSRNPVYAALSLVLTLFGVAILFVEQDAQFLAAVQVIVYAGAIVVLFLFVIMLLGVDRQETLGGEPLRAQRPLALIVGLAGLGEVLALARVRTWATGAASSVGPTTGPGSNVEKLARSIFTTYLLPFELTSALLIIAVIGAVVLARRPVRGVPPEALPTEDLDVPVGPGDGVRAVDGEPLADEEVASR
ncbi:MAG TPA: NADH-quinone oxidoreductase subunit J [Acidimicrobiales bacterium]|nr:NADH-quinone oxidoreductase subunit J [Acidimicrobiales bacterium]